MAMDQDQLLLLGRIEGKLDLMLDKQAQQDARLDGIDNRLRHVETQAARTGAISGGIAAIGMALVAEMLKRAIPH